MARQMELFVMQGHNQVPSDLIVLILTQGYLTRQGHFTAVSALSYDMRGLATFLVSCGEDTHKKFSHLPSLDQGPHGEHLHVMVHG